MKAQPVIHSDYNIFIDKDESKYPELSTIHSMTFKCDRCGNTWMTALAPENKCYRVEAEKWRDMFLSVKSKVTELMRFSEMNYNMNPQKDMFIAMLDDLKKRIDNNE